MTLSHNDSNHLLTTTTTELCWTLEYMNITFVVPSQRLFHFGMFDVGIYEY